MTRATPEMRLGVAPDNDGVLYIPAQQVTELLRRLADQWHGWAEDGGEPVLDAGTVAVLSRALCDAADQVDVECIARTQGRSDGREKR